MSLSLKKIGKIGNQDVKNMSVNILKKRDGKAVIANIKCVLSKTLYILWYFDSDIYTVYKNIYM